MPWTVEFSFMQFNFHSCHGVSFHTIGIHSCSGISIRVVGYLFMQWNVHLCSGMSMHAVEYPVHAADCPFMWWDIHLCSGMSIHAKDIHLFSHLSIFHAMEYPFMQSTVHSSSSGMSSCIVCCLFFTQWNIHCYTQSTVHISCSKDGLKKNFVPI